MSITIVQTCCSLTCTRNVSVVTHRRYRLNKENRKLLQSLVITCHCVTLGRSSKPPDKEADELMRKVSASRNGVEVTFGTAKLVYDANDIWSKLPETAWTWIGLVSLSRT